MRSWPLLLFGFLISLVASHAQEWHVRHPTPFGESLRSVAFGNGGFVAAGQRGRFALSTNGHNWELRDSRLGGQINNVSFLNSNFVGIGNAGLVTLSSDGRSWLRAALNLTNDFRAVTYGNGLYLVVGTGGLSLRSEDGVNWSALPAPPPSDWPFLTFVGAAFGNGKFVVMDTRGEVRFTPDGRSWLPIKGKCTPFPHQVFFHNGIFFAPDGDINWSADGLFWSNVFYNPGPKFLTFGNGVLVGIGENGQIWRSTNGIDYQRQTQFQTSRELSSAAYGYGTFVAVGEKGTIRTSSDGLVWKSLDQSITERGSLNVLRTDGSQLLVAGESAFSPQDSFENAPVLLSTNGENWTRYSYDDHRPIRDAAYGPGRIVMCNGPATFLSTNGGVSFARSPQVFGSGDARNLLYTRNKFYLTGPANKYRTSDDGALWDEHPLNWSRPPAPTNSLTEIVTMIDADGLFLATAQISVFNSRFKYRLLSHDGITWTVQPSAWDHYAYGNGIIVAAGYGVMFSSTNGIDWTERTRVDANLLDVAFGNSRFVAVGENGSVLTSRDGANWRRDTLGTSCALQSVVAFQNTFVAVGEAGTILQLGSLKELSMEIHGHTEPDTTYLGIIGPAPSRAVIQTASSVAGPWADYSVIALSASYLKFQVTNSSPGQSFYRARQAPDQLSVESRLRDLVKPF